VFPTRNLYLLKKMASPGPQLLNGGVAFITGAASGELLRQWLRVAQLWYL
jgi:hypothetical protein